MNSSSPVNRNLPDSTTVATSSSIPPTYVADTVALVLHLENRTMGTAANQVFQAIEQQMAQLLLPAMVFAEIMYLSRRKRITATLIDVETYLDLHANCKEAPLTLGIVKAAQAVTDISELHDRLIAATAIYHNALLLTNDTIISGSMHLRTLW